MKKESVRTGYALEGMMLLSAAAGGRGGVLFQQLVLDAAHQTLKPWSIFLP